MTRKTKIITLVSVLVIFLIIYSSKYIFASNQYHASDYTGLVNAVNTANDGDIVVVDNDITLSDTISVTKKIKIMGMSNFKLTLPSGSNARHITSSADLQIDNLTLDGSGTGGGIQMTSGSINVTNSNFKNNTAFEGGAIFTQGNISITNCEFDNNKSTHNEEPEGIQGQYTNINGGGAICAINNSTVTIQDSIFTNNVAISRGGAIFVNGSITVTECLFKNNKNTNFDYDTGYGGAIFAARSTGTFNVDKCQFTGNSSGAGGGIGTFIPLTITDSCFDSNNAVGGSGAAIINCVTHATITNSTFTNSIGTAILEWDNPIHYPGDPKDNNTPIPKEYITNCTFWGNNGNKNWYTDNINRMYFLLRDDNKNPITFDRYDKSVKTVFIRGCIYAYAETLDDSFVLEGCVGYDFIDHVSAEGIFMSSNPTLNYRDTEIKIGTGDTTLQIGYYPIKPFGRADDKIDSSTSWAQKEDQNGVTRGQAYNDGKTYIDIGAIEELGNIYDKKDSGDNQVAIVNTNFQDPLKVQVYYDSTTQPGLRVFLKDFVFTSVSPTPADNGASATLSASTVNTDDNGFAQVTATANDKIGEYTVKFVPNDNYNGRIITKVENKDNVPNYFDDIVFTLTNISKTIHVRQVVINGVDELEAPNQGYIRLSSSDSSNISNLTVDSGKNELGVNYTTFLMNAKPANVYELAPIVPEYYDYAGYIKTDTDIPHDPDSRTFPGYPTIDFTNNTSAEYWITIYITPKSPDSYSWSDAVNDFHQQN